MSVNMAAYNRGGRREKNGDLSINIDGKSVHFFLSGLLSRLGIVAGLMK